MPEFGTVTIPVFKSGVGRNTDIPLTGEFRAPDDNEMRIWVLASTGDKDEQDEKLLQKLLDISYLTKDGKYIWGHSKIDDEGRTIPKDPEDVLGDIDIGSITKAGLYSEGVMFNGKRKAIDVFNDLKNNPGRCPHKASIEGSYKVFTDRNGQVFKSAVVRNIAFDLNVINTNTMAGVLKSLTTGGMINGTCRCLKSTIGATTPRKIEILLYHETVCNGNQNILGIKNLITKVLKR